MLIHSVEGIKEACLYSDGGWNIFCRPSTTASLESGFSLDFAESGAMIGTLKEQILRAESVFSNIEWVPAVSLPP